MSFAELRLSHSFNRRERKPHPTPKLIQSETYTIRNDRTVVKKKKKKIQLYLEC